MWHLELRENWFIQDTPGERLDGVKVVVIGRLSTFHLKSDELMINFLKFEFIIVKLPLLKNSGGGTP